jgi:hypothetical protein
MFEEFVQKILFKRVLQLTKKIFSSWTKVASTPLLQCSRGESHSNFEDFKKCFFWPFYGSFHFSCDDFLGKFTLLPFHKLYKESGKLLNMNYDCSIKAEQIPKFGNKFSKCALSMADTVHYLFQVKKL